MSLSPCLLLLRFQMNPCYGAVTQTSEHSHDHFSLAAENTGIFKDPKELRCFLFFSHILHPEHSFPFLTFLPSLKSVTLSSLLPQTFPYSISPQKRAGLPGTSNKHDLTNYNKIRHIRSYQDWIRQPRRGKSFPKADKRGRA